MPGCSSAFQRFETLLTPLKLFTKAAQSVFYPGAMYLLSRWYTRKVNSGTQQTSFKDAYLRCLLQELAFRSAILYGGLLISNAFGSVSKLSPFHLSCTLVRGAGSVPVPYTFSLYPVLLYIYMWNSHNLPGISAVPSSTLLASTYHLRHR